MPSYTTIAVIGDIHGCFYTLKKLYSKLKRINEIYSVGDLIDRGRFSKEVVQFCQENVIKCIRGNHEDMMIKAVDQSGRILGFMHKEAEHYYMNGGQETQYSYIQSREFADFKKFKSAIKSSGHYDYINTFPLFYEFKKVIISHAGIIEGGNEISIMWNRDKPAVLGKLQIFGHTPNEEMIYKKHYYANIDTACVYKNKLTAVIVDTNTGLIEDTIQVNCDEYDVREDI